MSIKVGKPDASPDTPSHTRGVHQGNKGPMEKQRGYRPDGRATAERSTAINPDAENPIDPRMPNLSPA